MKRYSATFKYDAASEGFGRLLKLAPSLRTVTPASSRVGFCMVTFKWDGHPSAARSIAFDEFVNRHGNISHKLLTLQVISNA